VLFGEIKDWNVQQHGLKGGCDHDGYWLAIAR
jgi:hypothetical protein